MQARLERGMPAEQLNSGLMDKLKEAETAASEAAKEMAQQSQAGKHPDYLCLRRPKCHHGAFGSTIA